MALPTANTVIVKFVFPVVAGALGLVGNAFFVSRQIDSSSLRLREDMIRIENTLRTDHDVLRYEMRSEISGVKSEIIGVKSEISGVKSEISGVKHEMRSEISGVKQELARMNETLSRVLSRQDEVERHNMSMTEKFVATADTSDESKQHSKEVLDNEYNGGDIGSKSDERKNPNNMAGGLAATLKNPNVSQEATHSAKERLDDME